MRRKILSFLLGFLGLALQAQVYEVSTEVQPKHVLLEEFTALRCGYCPEGHKKAEELKMILGDRVSVVAIHCGYLSNPGTHEPDFRVDAGEEIGDFIGASNGSFPSGAVNRRDWEHTSTYSYSRISWKNYAREIVEEKAPVNLWGKAQIDAQKRELKVEIQGFFTEDITGPMPRLTVLLTQNNVLGLQYGGGMGDLYPHQHMLRAAITDAMGEELDVHQKGEYFVREYTYPLPEKYKEIAVDMTELELVAFVTRDRLDVLNALTVKPDYIGETLPLRASISHPMIPVGDGYSYRFVPLMLTNRSNVPLTSAKFDVMLNAKTVASEWQGMVPPFATQEIRIPVDWSVTGSSNIYNIALTSLNGQPYEGNLLGGNFAAPATLPSEVILHINTDENAGDNTYRLCDGEGNVVKTFGPFANGSCQSYEEKLSLQPSSIYCLEVTDTWGNGIYAHGNAIEFVNEAGEGLLMQTVIQNFGARLFFRTDVPSGVEVLPLLQSGAEIYNMTGHKVATVTDAATIGHLQLPQGVYVLRTAQTSHKFVVK